MSARDPALDHAGRFGDFLTDAITEFGGEKPTADKLPKPALPTTEAIKPAAPNKYAELADLVARSKKAHSLRADKFIERVLTANESISAKFDQHEEGWDQHVQGVESLDDIDEALSGDNSKNADE